MYFAIEGRGNPRHGLSLQREIFVLGWGGISHALISLEGLETGYKNVITSHTRLDDFGREPEKLGSSFGTCNDKRFY